MTNTAVWFDLPVENLDRAVRFYSAVLAGKCEKQEFPGMTFALFPHYDEEGSVSGCLVPGKKNTDPDPEGRLLLYFNCEGRLDDAISKVEANGGKVAQPKHQIGPHGFRAIVLDSEGNRVALHSR
jgi:predicted enzyme related to lactoylglutathione lyase